MVLCLIGLFKELTGKVIEGDTKDVGGVLFKYIICFLLFVGAPMLFTYLDGVFPKVF